MSSARLLVSVAVILSQTAPAASARAAQSAPATAAAHRAELPPVAEVLAAVRRAVGYSKLRAMRHGLMLVEREEGGAGPAQTIHLGSRRGEVRRSDEFGFDGFHAWQHDNRRRAAVPAPLRQREKLAFPLWVRSHWWLHPRSGMAIEVLPQESKGDVLALSLRMKEGLLASTLYLDRKTWLPARLVLPYERGPFEATYSDYRTVHGVALPFRIENNYRDRSVQRVVSVAPLTDSRIFAPPPLPADHAFDPERFAELVTREGAPFGPGSPGHVYVRAAADGREGWWHFDSGSDSMIIDEAVADSLGMEVIGTTRSMGADGTPRSGTWRRGKSFSIGRIRVENPVFGATDLSANNAPPGERRMGTIGYDLFARSVVEYAGGGRDIRICDPGRYKLPKGGRWRALEHIDSTPAVRASVEGIAGLFQVDTGAAGSVDFARPFHERHRLLEGRPTRSQRLLGAGGTFSVENGRVSRFDFAGRSYRDLEVSFRTGGFNREGSAGTVGREVLEPFRTIFDYPNRRIAFVPLSAGKGRC